MRKILFILVALVCTSCSITSNDNIKEEAYYNYYLKVEALLDSCSVWDSSFSDTIVETDVYAEYLEARKAVRLVKE